MSFVTTVYIDSDEKLSSKTECLRCILDAAAIYVEVEIDFDYKAGYQGDYHNPPEVPESHYTHLNFVDISFDSDDKSVEESIKVLMTKEQKEAIEWLAESIIDRDWIKHYEEQAFNSLPGRGDLLTTMEIMKTPARHPWR